MSDKLSIKLNIANRIYPMKIDRKSEEFIRNAVKKIENRLKFYEQNYAIKDKQDLLAMCALQLSSKVESSEGKTFVDTSDLDRNIDAIEANISAILERSFT